MKIYLILLFNILVFTLFAQSTKTHRLQSHESSKYISFDNPIKANQFFSTNYQSLGLESEIDMQFKYKIKDKSGFERVKYQQYYLELPVIGGTYILHTQDDYVLKSTGNIYPDIEIETTPKINVDLAKSKAIKLMLLLLKEKYINFDESQLKYHDTSNDLCIIDKQYPRFSGQYALAYEIEINAFLNGPLKYKYYIDAITGNVLTYHSEIHSHNVIGSGETIYYGEQNFIIDSIGEHKYLLQDKSRGNGIYVVDGSKERNVELEFEFPVLESNSRNWDFEGRSPAFSALDAHYCSAKYYDMLSDKFNRNSIDNLGLPLVSVVHKPDFFAGSSFFVNAFWDGEKASFGDGDCLDYSPLTTMTIIGHEFTHGLTDYTSNLVYESESGAINEAMSDIFGKALEYYYDKEHFNWTNDKLILTSSNGKVFRNMKYPHNTHHPKYYKGKFWDKEEEVHTNSNVFNYWFYLLVDGDNGKTEKNVMYDVASIGMDKAIDIVYGVQTGYLTETSNYRILYAATIEETIDLFGENSVELESVKEAWKAVGITAGSLETDDIHLELTVYDIPKFNEYFPIAVCDLGEPFNVKYSISNGGIDLLMDKAIEIIFSMNNTVLFTKEIVLDKPLLSGEILELTDNINLNPELLDTYGDATIKIEIEILGNTGNPDDHMEIIEISQPGQELNLFIRNVNSNYSLCESDYQVKFFILNIGCQSISKGEQVKIICENERGRFISDYTFTETLGRDNLAEIEIENLPEGYGAFEVTLEYFVGTEMKTNMVEYTGPGSVFDVDVNETLKFEHIDDLKLFKINGRTSLVKFNGNRALGFVGKSNFTDPLKCEDAEDFFVGNRSNSLDFCVDAVDMVNPKIGFDLTFIKNKTQKYSIPKNFYTMVKVNIGEKSFPVIFDQDDEEIVYHYFDVPNDFQGEVTIKALVLGVNNNTNSTLDKNNWVLIDNLKFYDDNYVGIDDVVFSKFEVNPNPASNTISISPENINKKYDVYFYNILGNEIGRLENQMGNSNYDISNFHSGTTFYQIHENGKLIFVGKLAIIN